MADRTQDAEEKLTGNRPPAASDNTGRTVPARSYQEGRTDSIGGGPSGTDTDDRTGEGQRRKTRS